MRMEMARMQPEALLAVARGDRPADLLLTNARVVNVFSNEIVPTDIAIAQGDDCWFRTAGGRPDP